MNVKLLIVEDDLDQLELIRETLEDHFGRNTVSGATTSKEALSYDLASFDMILCDYNLPDSTGLDLLDHITRQCSTPVIMVTGENVASIAAEAVSHGASDYVVKLGDYIFTVPLVVEKNLAIARVKRENESLRRQLEHTLAELQEKNEQLERSLQQLEELAATDPLTGLYNRRHFAQLLEKLFSESQRYDNDLACVMIDLDGYKQLNDTFGHQVGDQLLVLAGKVIRGNLRKMDTAARYGGDEFVLLLPRAASGEAAAVAQRIREEFAALSAQLLNRLKGVSMSCGVASLRAQWPAHADQLVAAADVALYQAKSAGRGRTTISTAQPATRATA